MRRFGPIVAVAFLGACNAGDEVAYILQWDRVQVVLDDDRPTRAWDLQLETNEAAARSGLTWTTVDVDATVSVEPIDPWEDQFVDASLTGDEVDEEVLQFVGPGQGGVAMRERYQADCVAGDSCSWSYLLVMTRRDGGRADIALDMSIRALVTLGTEEEASEAAVMTVEAVEIEPE